MNTNTENLPVKVPEKILHAVQEQRIDLKDVHLMLPSLTFGEVISQYDKITLEVVKVDPNPQNGEVYEITKGKKALGKTPLQKIAMALGIGWDPNNTRIVSNSGMIATAMATGAMRKPNGEYIVSTESKTIDLTVLEDELTLKYDEETEKGNPDGKVLEWGKTQSGKSYPKKIEPFESEEHHRQWIDRKVKTAILQKRKFKTELAMTGAKLRVIRSFIAIKSTYTDAELQRPFAFPRVTTDVSKMLENPDLRQAAISRMTGAASSIFGDNSVPADAKQVGPVKCLPAETEDQNPFDDMDAVPQESERDQFMRRLADFVANGKMPENGVRLINDALKNPEVSDETLRELVGRAETASAMYDEKKPVEVAQ